MYFCQPIYKEWLVEAIAKGRISAPGFFSDPVIQDAWSGSVWTGPGQGQLDPLRDAKATILRIRDLLPKQSTVPPGNGILILKAER